MQIAIVGAGIAGLSLAHELRQQGLDDIVVLEQAETFHHVGAGIHLGPWGMSVLDANGVGAAVRDLGVAYRFRSYYDRHGDLLGRIDFIDLAERHTGATGVFIHRAQLHAALAAAVPPDMVTTGATVENVTDDKGPVTIDTGKGRWEADILVGCDGLHSRVRQIALGVGERALGKRSLRAIVEAPSDLQDVEIYRGLGSTIGLARIDGAGHAYAWTHVAAGPPGVDPLPSDPASALAEVLATYDAPRMRDLAERLRSADVVAADLFEVVVPTWWRGRTVLAGDAAHAMSPSAGSGGAMAFEDAAVLARLMAGVSRGSQSLDAALDRYVRQRLPRVEGIRAQARYTDYDAQLASPDLCRHRDERFAALLSREDAFAAEVSGALTLDAPPGGPADAGAADLR